MAEGTTDSQGRFSLSGWTDEVYGRGEYGRVKNRLQTLTIDPKVNIYHDCDDGIMVSISLFLIVQSEWTAVDMFEIREKRWLLVEDIGTDFQEKMNMDWSRNHCLTILIVSEWERNAMV